MPVGRGDSRSVIGSFENSLESENQPAAAGPLPLWVENSRTR